VKVTIGDSTGLKHRICISCRSAELERRTAHRCFPEVRDGHGSGPVGTHGRRIWYGRYRWACCRGFLGSLSLRLSKGSSGRCGRSSEPPARAERRTDQAASPEGVAVLFPEPEGSPNSVGIAMITMMRCGSRSRTILARAIWKSGNAVFGGSDRGARCDRGIPAARRIA
jgi:hypothetical protein